MVTHIFASYGLLQQQIMRRDVFQAISDPTRRAIINMLSRQSLNLNAVADKFEISRPAISRHIRILRECGIIIIKQQGRERYCEANLESFDNVSQWVEQCRSFWTSKLDALEIFLEKEKPRSKASLRKKANDILKK